MPHPVARVAGPSAGRATIACCRGLSHWYDASLRGVHWSNQVLPTVSLMLGAASFEAVIGEGAGPVTLLHCIAGLVVPREGRIEWRDSAGRCAARPRIAFIPANWRPYRCLTVRDVLEQAVPPGTDQGAADSMVSGALERCELSDHAWHRARGLTRPLRPILATAAAVVSGAEWVLLEMGGGRGSVQAPDDIAAYRKGASAIRRLARAGVVVLVAGPPGCYAPWVPRRVHPLPPGGLRERVEVAPPARVAEGSPVATVSAPT